MKQVPACVTRVLPLVLALGLGATGLGLGCKAKPSEKACREAIENIRRISGQDANTIGADPVAAIRSCRGNSSKEAVECMRVAKTIADLEKCEGQGAGLPGVTTTPAPTAAPAIDAAAKVEPAPDAAAPAESAVDGGANVEPATETGAKAEPATETGAKAEPAKAEPAKAEPANVEPAP